MCIALVSTRDISIRYFPFNSDCNPFVTKTLHSNACWAARAAETAGMLWGPEGFWKMHVWLFDRRGVFETTRELEEGIDLLQKSKQKVREELSRCERSAKTYVSRTPRARAASFAPNSGSCSSSGRMLLLGI